MVAIGERQARWGAKVISIHTVASLLLADGGPSYTVPALVSTLSASGHPASIVTVSGADCALGPAFDHMATKPDFASVPLLKRLRFSKQMLNELRLRHVDILHTHGLWLLPNVYPAIVAKEKKLPLVLSPRGMLSPEALAFSKIGKSFFWHAAQRSAIEEVSCFHATSDEEARDISLLGLRKPIAVIPNGIGLPNLENLPQRPSGEQRRLIYLGRIHPKKGLPDLLTAWSNIERLHQNWFLEICGPDESGHTDHLRRLAAELGLMRAEFTPPVYGDAKFAKFRTADVSILPTHNENFGITVAESLAVETPVIVTYGAPWQGLETNKCGWWIKRDPSSIENAISESLSMNRADLDDMGKRGRDWMRRDYSWDRIGHEMATVYRWLGGQDTIPDSVIMPS